jgi:hypothetical protein
MGVPVKPRRVLQVLVAEPAGRHALRDLVPTHRRIRPAATEQECLDLAYAGSADVMLVDLEAPEFADPGIAARVHTISRHAFPILGVASLRLAHPERWLSQGLSDVLVREGLTPVRLDRALRHWVKYQRTQRRLFDAERRALQWWKDLVDALDEVRRRTEHGCDALEAFLGLLEGCEGETRERRQQVIWQARRQVAELNQINADLDFAARVIQLKGLQRSRQQSPAQPPAVRPEAWFDQTELEEDAERSIDRPPVRGEESEERRYGT